MGFTTGLLSGITLTTSVIYLSLTVHNQTRLRQSALLHQQTHLINGVVDPQPLAPVPVRREVQAGMVETAKDMWNAELAREVRVVQNVDWNQAWDRFEDSVTTLYQRAFKK